MINAVRADQVRRSLGLKGFLVASGDRDHEMFFYWHNGKRTNWWVKVSHGAPSIWQAEIKRNAKSLGLTGDDLHSILACNHDHAKVIELYQQINGAEDDASCPSLEHPENDEQNAIVDSRSRPWHRACAARQLQAHPWTHGTLPCPACGGHDGARDLMDTGRRLWHSTCAARVLGES